MKVYLVFQRDLSEEDQNTHVSAVFKDKEKAEAEVHSLLEEAYANYSSNGRVVNDPDDLLDISGLEFWYSETEVTE